MIDTRFAARGAVIAGGVVLAACAPTIAGYQEQAYRNATTLKAETHALYATSATVPYAASADRIERLSTDIDAAYNYAAGLSRNQISATQWRFLRDGIVAPFVATWRAEGKVSPAAVAEDEIVLDAAFDQIICLEANKRAATRCATGAK